MPHTLSAAQRKAVNTIVSEAKPLKARSIVASTLLGVDPHRLPPNILVRSGELFGISQGTTRVAISRMCANGELISKHGTYRLAGAHLSARAQRQDISRSGRTRPWDGSWKLALVVVEDRDAAARIALRDAARTLRLAERREGVWMRPDNLPDGHDDSQPESRHVLLAQCELLRAYPSGDPIDMASKLFPLRAWAQRAQQLHAAFEALIPALETSDMALLGDAFVVGSSALRHYQQDPLLPVELLPTDWPGELLRADYDAFDGVFKAAWIRCFEEQS